MILTPLQKLPNNVGDLDTIIVAASFEWCPKFKKSPILVTLNSHLNLLFWAVHVKSNAFYEYSDDIGFRDEEITRLLKIK